jgi:two-component system, chemotaxis family, chemotaxis protein CheY
VSAAPQGTQGEEGAVALELLVVDDSPVTRKMVRRAIGLCGLKIGAVYEAGNGAEALAQLALHRVDLVLADVNMPVMNGMELVERMGADPVLSRIPVIIVATPMSEQRIERLLDIGARAYLAKPFRPEALKDLVLEILGKGGSHG